MIIGFTGTQEGMTKYQYDSVVQVCSALPIIEFHHGDCVGADAQAHGIAKWILNCKIHIHPPTNKIKRAFKSGNVIYVEKPYSERNRNIVDICEFLIATPKSKLEEIRSGTWATIRYARKKNKKMCIIYPDGSTTLS